MFITCFGHFNVCFYFVGDGQVKRSKNKQKGVKESKNGQSTRACRGMVLSCRVMRPSSQKTQGWHAAACPIHAAACQGKAKTRFSIHAATCQIMPRHDDADKTMLFLTSRVLGLLCNTTFFVSIKKK